MRKQSLWFFLLGIFCGGAVVGGIFFFIRPMASVKITASPKNDPANQPRAESNLDTHGKTTYALDRYCPVTLQDQWEWKLGRLPWSETRGNQVYLFAGSDQQRLFQADPERYMPYASGNDVVLAKEEGQTVPGKRRHGVTYGDRIFLFASEDTLHKFFDDPRYYLTSSDVGLVTLQ